MTPPFLSDLLEKIPELYERYRKERGHFNVLIAGPTGVGKSTLVNAVFSGDFAGVGQGRPVSQEAKEYTREGYPFTVIDTKGIETADYQATIGAIRDLVAQRRSDPDPNRHVHVAWLCISESSRRVQQSESELLELLAPHVPVVVVITQAMDDDGFETEVRRLMPNARQVVRVLARTRKIGTFTVPVYGLQTLVAATLEVLPEGQRNAYIAAQKVSVELKRAAARKTVVAASASAAGVAAAPLPFADALAILPIQVGMLVKITLDFGLSVDKGTMMTMLGGVLGSIAAAAVGRGVVGGLLKLIPGVGSVLGGAINAAVAASLTSALGALYIEVIAKLMLDNPDREVTAGEVVQAFTAAYRKEHPEA